MNERSIQNALWQWRNRMHKFVVPNARMIWGESDLISITKAGFVYDHEIKISRRDFFADKKKFFKHLCFNNAVNYQERLPNYFSYVVPTNLVSVFEIPEYAGLVYIDSGYGITVVKTPPLLHKTKIANDVILKLCSKLMWRYWNARVGA